MRYNKIICLLTFYLFDEIEKNRETTHANYSATSKAILTKMLVQPVGLHRYSYLAIRYVSRYLPHDMIRIAIHF